MENAGPAFRAAEAVAPADFAPNKRDGQPNVDPTKNVLDLVAAESRRQDDLRLAEAKFQEAGSEHIKEVFKLRAESDEKLRLAEANRIDAIRAVDVGAVNRAAEVSAAQALTLATQVATSAETLRTQVAAAAQASTVALAAALEPIQKDIADLRRVQYEQQGQKAAAVETRSDTSSAKNLYVAIAGVAATLAAGLLGIAGVAIAFIVK